MRDLLEERGLSKGDRGCAQGMSEIFSALRSVVSKVKSCGGAATVQMNNVVLNISPALEMT
jgi:hypothetical protein